MVKNIKIPCVNPEGRKGVISEMMRVDHAGEYGAVRIYSGQMAALQRTDVVSTISHMLEQEKEHFSYFDCQLKENRVRPSALMPFWHVSGYALGFVTGLMGKKAAMACTVAVEEEIDNHYEQQVEELDENDEFEKGLREKIERFQAEELEHRDIGIEHEAKDALGYKILYNVIRTGCKIAIKLAKKI